MNLRKSICATFLTAVIVAALFLVPESAKAQQPFGRGGQFNFNNFGGGNFGGIGTGLGISIGRGGVGVNFGSGYYPNRNQYNRPPFYGPRPQYYPPAYANPHGYPHYPRAPYAVPTYPPVRRNYPAYPPVLPYQNFPPQRTYVPAVPFVPVLPVPTYPRLSAPAPAPQYQSDINPYELGFVPKTQAQEEEERLQAQQEHNEHDARIHQELERHKLEMERIRQGR